MSSPSPTTPPDSAARPRAALVTVGIHPSNRPWAGSMFVAELDRATILRIRQQALTMRAREQQPVTIELRYVADPEGAALITALEDLRRHDVHLVAHALGDPAPARNGDSEVPAPASPATAEPRSAEPAAAPTAAFTPRSATTPEPMRASIAEPTSSAEPTPSPHPADGPDPFGIDHDLRARAVGLLQVLFERYWRVEVSGTEHVPSDGGALIAANHSGAIPVDAVMLSVALELRHPAQRPLRVLYDKFVDALPFLGPLYNRLGAVSASLANAELLLQRDELVGLFPEGIAGVEKRFTERYRLRPFKTGTARLSIRTGKPIIPVAIVGAEEAYPVIARLYRAGRAVGLPWIPVTPLFPHFGLVGAVPFPSKWHIRFCPPIVPPAHDTDHEEHAIAALTDRLRTVIATALADVLAKRRSVFV